MQTERRDNLTVTSLSLLARLRDGSDQKGWDEFVARYGPKIEAWCLRWGLQAADAQDVMQNVLLQISRQMEKFEYNPSGRFRSWLKTVAWRAWADFLNAQQRNHARPNQTDPTEQLYSIEAREDLFRDLADEADRELLDVAMRNVRTRVKEHTWEAFYLMTFENLSGTAVAERLGLKETSVFVACGRVRKMILDEVQQLDGENESLSSH